MKTIINLLNDETSSLTGVSTNAIGTWTVVQDATLQRSSARANSGFASLLITAEDSTVIVESSDLDTLPSIEEGERYRGLCRFHHQTSGREITVGVQFFDATKTRMSFGSDQYTVAAMELREWTLASVVTTAPPGARYAALRIEFKDVQVSPDPLAANYQTLLNDKYLWVDDAGLVKYNPIIESPGFLQFLRQWIPEYMREQDETQRNPDSPLLRFLDLVGYQMDDLMFYVANFDYLPIDEGGFPGETSILVDTSAYPDGGAQREWVLWMQQIVGTKPVLLEGTGFTSWDYLSLFSDWNAWETQINSVSTTYSQAITGATRTNGSTVITVGNIDGLSVGGVITVSGLSSTFNGIYGISALSSTTITYSQQYLIESITRAGTTVTVRTYRPHGLTTGDTVTISGTGVSVFHGAFTVTGTSTFDDTTRVFTFTTVSSGNDTSYAGTVTPANATSSGGTAATNADLEWQYLEGENPYPIDPFVSAAYQVRSGATGLWSGTREGLVRTSRIGVTGSDARASFSMRDGTVTVLFPSAHGYLAGDRVRIYDSPVSNVNKWHDVNSVSTDGRSFTVAGPGGTASGTCWVTDKKVAVMRNWCHVPVTRIEVVGGDLVQIRLAQQLNGVPAASGNVRIYNSGDPQIDALTYDGSITYTAPTAADPYAYLQFPSPMSNRVLEGGTLGSACTVLYEADNFSFLVLAPASATVSSATLVELSEGSKPAGAVVTFKALPEVATVSGKDVCTESAILD